MRAQTAFLRRYIGMDIRDVRDVPDGIVVTIGAAGRVSRTQLVLVGLDEVLELEVSPPPKGWDNSQPEVDIGDDLYERQRYDEQDIDIEPGRDNPQPPLEPR